MIIKSIELDNFRSYAYEKFDFDSGVNMICGENAQGKTNILEAIYFLSNIKTYRTSNKKEVIKIGEDKGSLNMTFFGNLRDQNMKIDIFQNMPLKISVNGVNIKKQTEAMGTFNSVLFCPEDLYLVREGSSARRKFIDTALCQLKPNYAKYLDEYNRLLINKMKILKNSEENPSLLKVLDDFSQAMANVGGYLIRYRAYFIKKLKETGEDVHYFMSGKKEKLSFNYQTVSTVTDPFADAKTISIQLINHYLSHKNAEIASKRCLSGPHKDDLEIFINDIPAKNYGSQGQIRTAVLSLKLSEREIFFLETGEYPVLLLDDVLSELDKMRQDFVINQIEGGQVMITCCEEDKLENIKSGKKFLISNGKIVK